MSRLLSIAALLLFGLSAGEPSRLLLGANPPPPKDCSACVDDCTGVANGDYEACDANDHFGGKYVTCSNGILIPDRPCAPSNSRCPLVYDCELNFCDYNQDCMSIRPCGGDMGGRNMDVSGRGCLSGPADLQNGPCREMANGDYAACLRPSNFFTCSNGLTYLNACAATAPDSAPLVWDDQTKRCEFPGLRQCGGPFNP